MEKTIWTKFSEINPDEKTIAEIRAIAVLYGCLVEAMPEVLKEQSLRFDHLVQHPEEANDIDNNILSLALSFQKMFSA